MRALTTLIFFSKIIDPIVSPFSAKRCNKCINVVEKNNVEICNECVLFFKEGVYKNSNRLQQKTSEEENLKKASLDKKDVLVLLSGGKDSLYLTLKLKETHPLLYKKIKKLVIIDTGFLSKQALKNAEKISQITKIPLVVERSHTSLIMNDIRDAFLSLKNTEEGDCTEVVDYAEGSAIFTVAEKIADGNYVLSGLTTAQKETIDGAKNVTPQFLSPMSFWNPDEAEITSFLSTIFKEEEISSLATNSTLIEAMTVIDIKKRGVSGFEKEFALLARSSKISRTEWISIFRMAKFFVKIGLLNSVANKELKKLSLTLNDICKK